MCCNTILPSELIVKRQLMRSAAINLFESKLLKILRMQDRGDALNGRIVQLREDNKRQKENTPSNSARSKPDVLLIRPRWAEIERICWDPKDGELYLSRMKPEETLVEVRSDSDVQIDRLTLV
ncbi:unnamed protein product [Onchocerca flexuosa]|uniref:Kinesin motor domain-containing protein n=1 Tax=Onchocerca flexuosa TaxID=387005 RepID=A0A183HYI1_9BILA|nr:unnamed protein product [Onchocerca flexuosa]